MKTPNTKPRDGKAVLRGNTKHQTPKKPSTLDPRPSTRLRQANEPVTQAAWDRLPLLLRASEVKWATGWTDAELAAEVKAGRVLALANGRRRGHKTSYKKYLKRSIGMRVGLYPEHSNNA